MQDLWSHGDIHSNRGLRDLIVCGMVRILVGKPKRTNAYDCESKIRARMKTSGS